MSWFHKGPVRNTTGHSLNGSFVVAVQRSGAAPRPDGWRAHGALPSADQLGARADPAGGLTVEAAKRHVASCHEAVQRQAPLSKARTRGRCASFFKAAAQMAGGCVGIGMGAAPKAGAAWERPDRPAPDRAAKKAAAKASGRAADPGADGLALTQALNQHHQLQWQREHLDGVSELLRAGLTSAQARHAQALGETGRCLQAQGAASAALAAAGRRFVAAERQHQALSAELRDATTGLRSQKQNQQALLERLRALGGHTDAASLDDIRRALEVERPGVRARRVLQDCEAMLAQSQQALRTAQGPAASPAVAPRQGPAAVAAQAHQDVLQALQAQHQRQLSLRDRARAQVQRLERVDGGAAGPPIGRHDESVRLLAAHEEVEQALEALRQRAEQLLARRAEEQPAYAQARHELAEATRLEATAAERRQLAVSRLEEARQACQGLQGQIDVLRPLAQELDTPQQASHTQVALLRQAVQNQQAARLRQLLHSPPGFEASAAPGLSAAMRALGDRLQSDAAAGPAAAQWPTNDALEAVGRALALASGGDAALAGATLNELMRRPLHSLVPAPGRWFDGSPRVPGAPVPPFGRLEALVGLLSELPCGAELLARLAAPASPAQPADPLLKEAVAVYHQATRATADAQTADSGSWLWLQSAAWAASQQAHPATPPVALSAQQLSAYHGVRNGFTSVCAGSAYDQANQQLKTFADEWAAGEGRHNPLKARRKAAVVATQVGLPTPIRRSNEELLQACERLQQAVTAQLVQAGREAARHGRTADAAQLEPLLEAASLLRYVHKHAGDTLRLDEMPLGRKAWRSIDRHTRRWMKAQAQPAAVPAATQAEVRRLGLPPGAPAGTAAAAENHEGQSAWPGLAFGLIELRVDKKTTVPQALQAIQDQLARLPAAPAANPRLPAIAEAPEEGDDVADDARDDILEQAARDLGAAEQGSVANTAHPRSDETQAALDRAGALKPHIDAFTNSKGRADDAALQAWIAPVVGERSSSLAMSRGHSLGVSTQSVSAAVSRVVGHMGLVVRADADVSTTRLRQLRWARQSRGMELFAGQSRQVQGRAGFTGGVGYAVVTLPTDDAFSVGAVGSWSASRSRSDTRGVLVRAPKYGDRAQDAVAQDFGAMVDTVLNWKSWRDENGEQAHSSPMQALLARHPDASVGTIEQLRTVVTTTRSGLAATVGGGGPMFTPLSGAIGFSAGLTSERRRERTQYKTAGGSQGFSGSTAGASTTVSAQLGYAGQLGGNVAATGGGGNTAVRGRTSTAMLQADLHRKQFQSSATLVRQPDGTLVGEKATEFNTFEDFEAAVRPFWDAWIEHGVAKGDWPETLSRTERRLLVEQQLQDFMQAAADSVRNAGTVTLNHTLDIRPEVCAELSACLALEELAQAQGRPDEASALHRRRQRLLEADASYVPYKLKAVVRSQVETAVGVDLLLSALRRQGASAAHEYDSFPKG